MPVVTCKIHWVEIVSVVAFLKDMYDKFISKAVEELKQYRLTTLKIICDCRNNSTRFRTNFCWD